MDIGLTIWVVDIVSITRSLNKWEFHVFSVHIGVLLIWNPAEGGRDVRAVSAEPNSKSSTRATAVRDTKPVNVSDTGHSIIDNEFDGEPMYTHQQEVVSMFDREEI